MAELVGEILIFALLLAAWFLNERLGRRESGLAIFRLTVPIRRVMLIAVLVVSVLLVSTR